MSISTQVKQPPELSLEARLLYGFPLASERHGVATRTSAVAAPRALSTAKKPSSARLKSVGPQVLGVRAGRAQSSSPRRSDEGTLLPCLAPAHSRLSRRLPLRPQPLSNRGRASL